MRWAACSSSVISPCLRRLARRRRRAGMGDGGALGERALPVVASGEDGAGRGLFAVRQLERYISLRLRYLRIFRLNRRGPPKNAYSDSVMRSPFNSLRSMSAVVHIRSAT